ncbi:MAG: hypothetical protein H8E10_16865 [Desulfobacterales bacterium]|nr:hypothetical protein [Desulfobacterales bacterium]
MEIVFRWWDWKDGQRRKTVPLPKIKNGYISKPAWDRFEAALKKLDGRKVRMKVEA